MIEYEKRFGRQNVRICEDDAQIVSYLQKGDVDTAYQRFTDTFYHYTLGGMGNNLRRLQTIFLQTHSRYTVNPKVWANFVACVSTYRKQNQVSSRFRIRK